MATQKPSTPNGVAEACSSIDGRKARKGLKMIIPRTNRVFDEKAAAPLRVPVPLPWGWAYRGTREQLIGVGLVAHGEFPGDPGRGKASSTFYLEAERKVSVQRASATSFRVEVHATHAEIDAHWFRRNAREAAAKINAAVEAAIARLSQTPSAYRQEIIEATETAVRVLVRPLLEGKQANGFKINDQALEAFDDAIGDALAALRAATVRVDRAARARRVGELRAAAAGADPLFKSFLADIVNSPVTDEASADENSGGA